MQWVWEEGLWMANREENTRINNQCNICLLIGGRLTLVKSILEAIPLLHDSLAYILKWILEMIQNKVFWFLWTREIETIIDYILSQRKLIQNLSTHWKVLVQLFPLIGNWLVQKGGVGEQSRIGVDPLIGCINEYKVLEKSGECVQDKGIYILLTR